MDSAGIERAAICGHSLGGLVAVLLAATAPDRVERLILVDAALLAFDPGLRNRAHGLARSIRRLSPVIAPLIVGDALRSGPFAFAGATRELLLAGVPTALAGIRTPTLVIWGEHDTVVPRSVGEAIVQRIPHARLAVIPDAAHNPMWEQPEAFNRLVLDFLHEEVSEGGDRTSRSGDGPTGAVP
jgi:pimeloyl-ACP methyl ester carboxylesterase